MQKHFIQKPIVVVGSLNLDLVAKVDRLPTFGETITGLDFQTHCGGKGANQAVALARLGASVKMIGKVGTDASAAQLLKSMQEAGVDVSFVEEVAGPSGTALITTSEEGANTIIVIPGANAALLPEDIDHHRNTIEGASMVLAQLEIPRETTEHLGKVVREAGIPFLLDPAPAYALSEELLGSVTWLTPNESETRSLLGRNVSDSCSVRECAEGLLLLGARNVVLKLGAEGVYLAGRDVEPAYVGGLRVKVLDTTAAGDAFNGAFALALAQRGMLPTEAAEFACGVAALSVTRAGAQPSMPTMPELERFLAEQRACR